MCKDREFFIKKNVTNMDEVEKLLQLNEVKYLINGDDIFFDWWYNWKFDAKLHGFEDGDYKYWLTKLDKTKRPKQLRNNIKNGQFIETKNDEIVGVRVKCFDPTFPEFFITGTIVNYYTNDSPFLYDVLIDADCYHYETEEEERGHKFKPCSTAYYSRKEMEVINE